MNIYKRLFSGLITICIAFSIAEKQAYAADDSEQQKLYSVTDTIVNSSQDKTPIKLPSTSMIKGKFPNASLTKDTSFLYNKSCVKMVEKNNQQIFDFDPSSVDVVQGNLGDWYFLAALASIAEHCPEYIKSCIQDNGDNTVTIRFYDTQSNNKPIYYRISKSTPENLGAIKSCLWVQLFEKAYVLHYNNILHKNINSVPYNRISHSIGPALATSHICGRDYIDKLRTDPGKDWIYKPLIPEKFFMSKQIGDYSSESIEFFEKEICNKLDNGYVLFTGSDDGFAGEGIFKEHCYSIIGYGKNVKTPSGKVINAVVLRNPNGNHIPCYAKNISGEYYLKNDDEGKSGIFAIDLNDFLKYFITLDRGKLPEDFKLEPVWKVKTKEGEDPLPMPEPPASILRPRWKSYQLGYLAPELNPTQILQNNLADPYAGLFNDNIHCSVHIQNIGWKTTYRNNELCGTIGKNLGIDAIRIALDNPSLPGKILYSTNIRGIGWTDWTSQYICSGKLGKNLLIEAIKIKLTGEISNKYDIYYRTFIQNHGFSPWVKNGEIAGTEGKSLRIEAIEFKLIEK